MHKLICAAALPAFLAGCAGHPQGASYDGGAGYTPNPYRSETGSPRDWSKPYFNDRYWPPVDLNSPFPPQIMDGGSKGR